MCVKEVRSFLGLASYYRRFVRGFAEVAAPLHALTEKAREFKWTEACEGAFEELKSRLMTAPVLSYPLPGCDYILDTDASGDGIGAVLSQVQHGEERVIAYASRKLSRAERNYCVTRRELLAVVVYLKQFRQYLYGRKVLLRSDHAALKWLLNFKNPEGQLARWLEVISEYEVTVEHRPGRKHGNADGLSRKVCKQCGRNDDEAEETGTPREPDGEQTPALPTVVDRLEEAGEGPEVVRAKVRGVCAQPQLPRDKIREAQLEDITMAWILRANEESNSRPKWEAVSDTSAAHKTLWSLWDQLQVRDVMGV